MGETFFEEIPVVAVLRADLCLFWKVQNVIYRQGVFFEEISVVAVVRADLCLF
jgi:hypothetical protein